MHGPTTIQPTSLADYLEQMTKAVFQAGISWRVVEAKWDGIRSAFHGFDAIAVASMKADEVGRVENDARVIRNRHKIEGTVDNAATMLALEKEFGSFKKYLDSLGDYEAKVGDLHRRFRFMGPSSAFFFLYVVGEQVPDWHEWAETQHRGSEPRTGSPSRDS